MLRVRGLEVWPFYLFNFPERFWSAYQPVLRQFMPSSGLGAMGWSVSWETLLAPVLHGVWRFGWVQMGGGGWDSNRGGETRTCFDGNVLIHE